MFGAGPVIFKRDLLTSARLSLDIEGAEHLVLKAFPWHLHTVHVISIERPDICSRTYLRKAGFHYLMSLSDQDEVWVHGSLPRFSQVCKGALKGRMSGGRTCVCAHKYALVFV